MERQTPRNRATQLPFQRLLKNNDLGIIENPLARIDEDELAQRISEFYRDFHLSDVVDLDVLIRGGHLARSEEIFVAEGSPSNLEKEALSKEKDSRFWEESKELRVILLTCSVASIVQGWVQAAIVGANQGWPTEFGLNIGSNDSDGPQGSTTDIWVFGAVNSIVYFAASSVGALLCDPLTEIFVGRRGAIFVAGILTFTASIGSAFTHSWKTLFACRFLLGVGMGAKSSVVPVYESEVSPARLRGKAVYSLSIPITLDNVDLNRPNSHILADRDGLWNCALCYCDTYYS